MLAIPISMVLYHELAPHNKSTLPCRAGFRAVFEFMHIVEDSEVCCGAERFRTSRGKSTSEMYYLAPYGKTWPSVKSFLTSISPCSTSRAREDPRRHAMCGLRRSGKRHPLLGTKLQRLQDVLSSRSCGTSSAASEGRSIDIVSLHLDCEGARSVLV